MKNLHTKLIRKLYQRICKYFLILLLTSAISCQIIIKTNLFNFHHYYSDYLIRSLEGPLKYDDEELIQYIKNKVLEKPSEKPYNLSHSLRYTKAGSERFYDYFNKLLFQDKQKGFFIEAGALDGQAMSNTLGLEMKQGWRGLLVEPDPSNYIELKKKNRKAWTANSCLSRFKHPQKEKLSSFDIVSNRNRFKDIKHRSMGSILQETGNKALTNDETSNSYYFSQCFPIASFLLALNVTRVELFSLDVEFVEEEVLRNFDFDRFDVQVLYIEWWMHEKLLWLNDFLSKKGFMFAANSFGDIIFVKTLSVYAEIIVKKYPLRKFIVFKNPDKNPKKDVAT